MVQDVARVGDAPYREVKELERATYVPEDLDCSLSLLAYMRHKAEARGKPVSEPTPESAAQGLVLGLRTDFTAIDDAVASLVQAYRAGEKLASILALATVSTSGQWHPVGTAVGTIFRPFVIDGAIRAIAAIEAGVRQVEVVYIAPTHPDTQPELLFMYFNSRHGVRLTTVDRDRVVRAMAQQYRKNPPEGHDGRDRHMFALWMGERCGLAASTIEEIIKGIFGVRTPEERQRAVQMMVVEGKSATEASRETGGSRQATKRLYDRFVRRNPQLGAGTENGHRPTTAGEIHVATLVLQSHVAGRILAGHVERW